jgi:hypothetical protein
MCVYGMKDDFGHRFLLRVERSPWDRKRYDQRLSLARGSGIREVVLLKDVGDAGFFVEGAAGALSGTRYIEISGFKAGRPSPCASRRGGITTQVDHRATAQAIALTS